VIRSEIFHGIRSVDPGVWGCVSAGHPYAGREWCLYGEAVLGCEGYYVILSCDGEPVGGACFSVLHQEQIPFRSPAVRALLERYLESHPLLACRTEPSTNFSGLFLPHAPELHKSALEAIRSASLAIAHECGASFVLFDYLAGQDMDLTWGAFTPLHDFLDVGTRLENRWESFDAYQEHLKAASLSRRKWLKRHLKEALAMGLDVRFGEHPDVETAARLHQNVERQHDEVLYPYTLKVMSHSRDLPGAVWMTAYYQDRLVSTELLLHDEANHVCTPTLYGRDYEADNVYFYTYYEVVRYAIEQLRVRTIVGNSGAYDFKHHLGFELDHRNNLVFSAASPLVQTIGGWLSRLAG
jgi:predicted N-acyltransferase